MEERGGWFRLVLGLFLVFGLFHVSATILGSDRGQHGILIGTLVVAATAAVDRFLLRRHNRATLRHLGLGMPSAVGVLGALGVAFLLLMVALLFVRARGLNFTLYPGWISLLPGLFSQAGIAEEVLFRGYLFGHVRVGRTFWRAHEAESFALAWMAASATVPWLVFMVKVPRTQGDDSQFLMVV